MNKGEGRREKSKGKIKKTEGQKEFVPSRHLTHPSSLKVGVLALQGAVSEHLQMVEKCGAKSILIKKPEELSQVDALIIPGGESTTIGKLIRKYGFAREIRKLVQRGLPVYGTCAGLILLAQKIAGSTGDEVKKDQLLLKLMDIEVRRNAFGRQKESFETDLEIAELGKKPFRGVFIRAPWIEKVHNGVLSLAKIGGKVVMARQGKFLVTAFHPELTNDTRIHQYFLEIVAKDEGRRTRK